MEQEGKREEKEEVEKSELENNITATPPPPPSKHKIVMLHTPARPSTNSYRVSIVDIQNAFTLGQRTS